MSNRKALTVSPRYMLPLLGLLSSTAFAAAADAPERCARGVGAGRRADQRGRDGSRWRIDAVWMAVEPFDFSGTRVY